MAPTAEREVTGELNWCVRARCDAPSRRRCDDGSGSFDVKTRPAALARSRFIEGAGGERAFSDQFGGAGGWLYDRIVNSRRLGPVAARFFWGMNLGRIYRMMSDAIGCERGEIVLDVACGGGTSFSRGAPATRGLLVGVDLSPVMLRYAGDRRRALGLDGRVAFVRANALSLPFRAGSAARALSFNGLQLVQDPGAVLGEVRRALRPGSSFVGAIVCSDSPWPWRLFTNLYYRWGIFVPLSSAQLEQLARAAGFSAWRQERRQAVVYFQGVA
jgi:SAM-dependent methyltransferase